MPKIITRFTAINKESLTTKLTLIIIGLTAGSALLIPATYASFHPVTSSEIADETILSRDIRNGQVGSVDIGTGQVASVDIRDGTITSADLGSSAVRIVKQEWIFSPGFGVGDVDCPSGQILTGGGFFSSSNNIRVSESVPIDSNTWEVGAVNQDTNNIEVTVYALCV